MQLVLFTLSLAAGAWFAWRWSPRYSAKRTLWSLAAMLVAGLILGLVPALLIPALPSGFQSAAIIGYIALVLAVTLAVSAFILRVTDGPMPKPRVGAPEVKVHRRKVTRIAKAVGIGLVLMFACDLVMPAAYRGLPSIFAGFLVLCAIPALYGLHHKASRYDRAATALKDRPWTVWRSPAAEIRLGSEGLLVGDEYTPWILSGTCLKGAWIESGSTLVFRFAVPFGHGVPLDKRVPMPRGADADLPTLQHNLRQVCPHAKIALA